MMGFLQSNQDIQRHILRQVAGQSLKVVRKKTIQAVDMAATMKINLPLMNLKEIGKGAIIIVITKDLQRKICASYITFCDKFLQARLL